MEPLIRAASLRGFVPRVEELGGDPAAYLRRFGLSRSLVESGTGFVAISAHDRMLDAAAEELGCTDFGLRLAESQDIDILGPHRRGRRVLGPRARGPRRGRSVPLRPQPGDPRRGPARPVAPPRRRRPRLPQGPRPPRLLSPGHGARARPLPPRRPRAPRRRRRLPLHGGLAPAALPRRALSRFLRQRREVRPSPLRAVRRSPGPRSFPRDGGRRRPHDGRRPPRGPLRGPVQHRRPQGRPRARRGPRPGRTLP